ncbi:polysaccharide deacetylase family protein [Reichenbachiella ulvae]|uniref:Polysaccharide deacetylase family protein n=1 Tax=Reichenbachiella ulvae TaxID=2980104 RepID=A0ABT3CWU8_9BACT|nr:polysaccharide deacetylase family protein [Reichenbachiella ulvae]MCV9388182.1 polysaccharide deacetylase family protein [Reichenbachiella ulvae]
MNKYPKPGWAILLFFLLFILGCQTKTADPRPTISFTFDDGSVRDMPGYPGAEWNQMILDNLQDHDLKAVFFVNGKNLQGEKGDQVLKAWNKAGHKIGNHTYSHPNFDGEITLEEYKVEMLKNDSIIRQYSNYYPYFRFPYLRRGNTIEKRDGFRQFLKEHNYRHGYVTADGYDWYINDRLVDALKKDSARDVSDFQEFYVLHNFQSAQFFDSLATAMQGRKIKHTMLLHHNLAAALFLDDLIAHFKAKGWEVIDAEEAFQDEIFQSIPNEMPAGGDLIGSIAKEDKEFFKTLVYRNMGSEYLKTQMDSLKL